MAWQTKTRGVDVDLIRDKMLGEFCPTIYQVGAELPASHVVLMCRILKMFRRGWTYSPAWG